MKQGIKPRNFAASDEERLARKQAYFKRYYQENTKKKLAQNTEWSRRNKEARTKITRKHILKKKYGLSLEDMAKMRGWQGNACAGCRDLFVTEPYVDHCHKTGKVRGLLCRDCNSALGLAKDDPVVLETLAAYLRSRSGL